MSMGGLELEAQTNHAIFGNMKTATLRTTKINNKYNQNIEYY